MNGDFIAGIVLGSIFMYLFLMLLRDRKVDKKAEKLLDLFSDNQYMMTSGATINAILSIRNGLTRKEYNKLVYMFDITYDQAKDIADSNLSNIYEINSAIITIIDTKNGVKDEII